MICSDQASLRKQVNSMATTHAATTSITSNTMHSQQQHWWSAARTLATLCQQLVATLSTAAGAGQVESALRQQLQLFGGATTTAVADPPSNQQQLEQQLCSHAAALGWDVLRGIWYQDQFETWASAVLAVAAGEWLPRLLPQGDPEHDRLWGLIADTFMLCPAWHALSALLGHLSAVTPHGPVSNSPLGGSVTAIAADSAAVLLQQRFLAPGSAGLCELLAACDGRTNKTSDAAATCCHNEQQQQCLSEQQVQQAAGLLAALPDRLHLLQPAVPQLPSIAQAVASLVQRCVGYVAAALAAAAGGEPQHGHSCSSNSSSPGRGTAGAGSLHWCHIVTPQALQLTATLMHKLVTRGHGSVVGGVVLQLAEQGAAAAAGGGVEGSSNAAATSTSGEMAAAGTAAQVERHYYTAALQQALLVMLSQQSAGAAAVEKLLVRVLRTATATTTQQPSQQQQQGHGQSALQALLCPLLAVSAQLRTIVLHKLLLARTLPTPTLQLLLQLLSGCRPSLLPEAAATLAKAWSDASSVLHVPVSQQAYMTAALVSCIQQLPREYLDPLSSAQAAAATDRDTQHAAAAADAAAAALQQQQQQQQQNEGAAGLIGLLHIQAYRGIQPEQLSSLLTSIVQGVSTRLSSPSPAIRLQAMRVGRGFAEKLDPAKPMFEDAGPLELMGEELWPGAAAVGVQQGCNSNSADSSSSTTGNGLSLRQQHQGLEGEQQQQQQLNGHDGGSSGSSTTTFKALARLAEATAQPDSDDEEDVRQDVSLSQQPTASAAAAAVDHTLHAGSSNSDSDDEGSGSSLLAFDLQEDVCAEVWWGPDGMGPVDAKGLGLRALAAALRKQDDAAGALEALKKVEVLVRAQPDELPVVAPELARALIHCKAPMWGGADTPQPSPPAPPPASTAAGPLLSEPQEPHTPAPKGVSSSAEAQRQRALAAVLALSPLTSGDTVIAELYSPHLDQYQRVLILDGLAAAAAEMSDPRKAPQLALSGPQKAPELLPAPGRGAAAAAAALPAASGSSGRGALPGAQAGSAASNGVTGDSTSSSSGASSSSAPKGPQVAPGMVESSSRVWGKVSLQKQAQAAAAAPNGSGSSSSGARTFRNRFAPVALRWAAALLQQCDVKHHGIDLFGRDSLLLGRLLTVLGAFVEASAETPAALPLCAGLLELLKAKEVSGHKEAFVRRSALVAASQVVRHLPPARLAGAMVGRQSDPQDAVLVERLQWLMSWAQGVAVGDADQHCRMLAAGCVAWHVELAEGAMAVLEHLPEPEGPSLVAAAAAGGKGGAGRKDVQVQLPTLDRLVLS